MIRVILGLSLALLFGLSALVQPAAAQITHFYVVIDVINCPSLPGPDEAPFDDVDHPCEPATGVSFSVSNVDTGEGYGSCISEVLDAAPARGQCLVLADIDTPLLVTQNGAPAGYLPVENPISITLSGTEPNDNVRFINVAQGQPPVDTYDFPIRVFNCPVAPTERPFQDIGQAYVEFVAQCDPGLGSVFTVTDATTGEVYGGCEAVAAEDYAQCAVPVTVGSTVVVTEDAAPAGYAPFEASLTREILVGAIVAGEPPYVTFINVLQTAPPAGAEPTPAPQLPNTGAGTTASRSAAAQGGTVDLLINKINCPEIPDPDDFPFANWEHECEPGPGIRFDVIEEGTEIGACVTEVSSAPEPQAVASCTVPVRYGTTVNVIEDDSTVPEGYVAVDMSVDPPVIADDTTTFPVVVTVDVPDGPGGDQPLAQFINVQRPRQDESSPQLPDTGTGTSSLKQVLSFFR